MRHYQNVDVTLDLILEAYSTQQGRFPALDAGFSFRIAGMVKTDVSSKSEIVPQYIDALYERLKIHLHVVIDGDLVRSEELTLNSSHSCASRMPSSACYTSKHKLYITITYTML